jgi:hypothetical protein
VSRDRLYRGNFPNIIKGEIAIIIKAQTSLSFVLFLLCGISTCIVSCKTSDSNEETGWVWKHKFYLSESGFPASSADGKHQIILLPKKIYTSGDYGVSWAKFSVPWTPHNWECPVASNSDGSRLVAVDQGGSIWSATAYGTAWTEQTAAGTRNWSSIASSSDGSKLVAAVDGGSLWTSADYGVTWAERNAAGTRTWSSVASSASGSRLAAAVDDGSLWTSADYGATWKRRTNVAKYWVKICMSPNGKMLAAIDHHDVWCSSDYGASWTCHTFPNSNTHPWHTHDIVCSADGSILAVTASYVDGMYQPSEPSALFISLDSGQSWAKSDMADGSARIAASVDMSRLIIANFMIDVGEGDLLTGYNSDLEN